MAIVKSSRVKKFTTGGDLLWHRIQLLLANIARVLAIVAASLVVFVLVFVHLFVSDAGRNVWMKTIVARLLNTFFMGGRLLTIHSETGESLTLSARDLIHLSQTNQSIIEMLDRIYWLLGLSVILALAVGGALVLYNHKQGKNAEKDIFLRGQKMISDEELTKLVNLKRVKSLEETLEEIKKDGVTADIKEVEQRFALSPITIAGTPIPEGLLPRNLLMVGNMGTGKTVALNQIIEDARKWGKKIVVYDKTGQFTAKWYRPGIDKILNVCDERCANWSAYADMEKITDAAMISSFFIQENKNSPDPIWDNAARIVLEDALLIMREYGKTMNELRHVIASYSHVDLVELISKHMDESTAKRIISAKNERGTDSVLMTLVAQPAFRFFRFFDKRNAAFSVRDFIRQDNDACLFLTSSPTEHEALKPFISVWLELALAECMSMGQSVNKLRVMFVIDELASLPKLKSLSIALTEARQFGVCTVIGLQNLAQGDDIYGKEAMATYISNLGNKLILRVEESDSAKRLADTIGKEEIEEVNEGKSFGVESNRDGVNLGTKRTERHLVLPTELTILPDLVGYLKIAGDYPVAKVRLKYKARPSLNPALIERPDLKLPPVDPTKFELLVIKGREDSIKHDSFYEPDQPAFYEDQTDTISDHW